MSSATPATVADEAATATREPTAVADFTVTVGIQAHGSTSRRVVVRARRTSEKAAARAGGRPA
ncbi:hypothetical protein GJ633_11395 [Halorubrum sp. CBA1125]|uniref:hypothetical protein n=1 Tax=Halorubrum sp. CBA1125 TaxID=2668072 RepID=UPI0012E775C2|nr:hypothetical protein [Halorubrum sp. CBA1125]MUW15188.1 hypothetical protein [Halorubrum sp. CBA1125]